MEEGKNSQGKTLEIDKIMRFENKHKTSSSVDSDETGDNGLKTSENKDVYMFQENETGNDR